MTTEPHAHHTRVRLVRRESPGQTTRVAFATHKATHVHTRQVERCRSNHTRDHTRSTHRPTTHATGVYLYPPCVVGGAPMSWPYFARLAADASISPQCPHNPHAHTDATYLLS